MGGGAGPDGAGRPARTDRAVQLSLFDVRPTNRVLCLPVAEIHGATFVRAFTGARPSAVVDLRSHPHFDMTSLSRSATFELFRDARSTYLHLPIDLRPPADQSARWSLRSRAVEVLDAILASHLEGGRTFAFLVNLLRDVPVLEAAMRWPDDRTGVAWRIEVAGRDPAGG